MQKSNDSTYRLRDKLHKVKGEFSKTDLLKQIRKGKLTGEEEIALYPFNEWKKLSSVPTFYDALLEQVLSQKSSGASPDSLNEPEASPKRSSHPIEEKGVTLQADLIHSYGEPSPEPQELQGVTEQIRNPAHTLHQSEIDELFSEAKEEVPGLDSDGWQGADQKSGSFAPLKIAVENESLESSEGPAESLGTLAALPSQSTSQRKRIYLVAALIFLLAVLFYSGDDKSSLTEPSAHSAAKKEPLESDTKEMDLGSDGAIYFERSALEKFNMDFPLGYQAAAEDFKAAIKLKPNDVHLMEGLILSQAKNIESEPKNEKLFAAFKSSLAQGRALDPQRTSFYRAEAIVERARGNKTEAQKLLDLALETDSLNSENHLLQADWFVSEGSYQPAKQVLEPMVESGRGNIRARSLLARALVQLRETEKAARQCQRIMDDSPTLAITYDLLGDVYSAKNDLKTAKTMYELAAKLSLVTYPENALHALMRAGNLQELAKRYSDARNYYVLATDFAPEHHPDLVAKLDKTPTEKEKEEARKLILADAAYIDRVGKEAMDSQDYQRAEQFYLTGTLLFPKDSTLWVKLGESRESLAKSHEEFRVAVVTYQKAIQVNPQNVEAYLRLGSLETAQSNFDVGFESLNKADSISPEDSRVQLELGKHFFARKDFRSAGERLRAAHRLNPNDSETSYYQGLIYKLYNMENPRAAIRPFEEAYSKNPQNYDALAEWLKLKVITFDKMFAVKFLRNLMSYDPKNPNLFWVFGEVYSANQEYFRAVNYYHRALDLQSTSSKVRMSLARALASLGKLDEAIAEYKYAADLDAKYAEGYFSAGEILYQTKNFIAARDMIQGLLKIVPGYPGARRLLALCFQASGDKTQSEVEMTKEVRANPKNYQFAIELVELLLSHENYNDAIKELGRITNLPIEKTIADPKMPTGFRKEATGLKGYRIKGLQLLSQCYRKMNKADVADGAIQSALALEPDNADLRLERGFVYHAQGRFNEAAEDFKYFLNKNGSAPEAPLVKQLLQKSIIEE